MSDVFLNKKIVAKLIISTKHIGISITALAIVNNVDTIITIQSDGAINI